jgi:hypothetical protein
MHQWIELGPVAGPVGLEVRQPKARGAVPPCIETDASHPWIEPDTRHQWVDPGPVAEAIGPEPLPLAFSLRAFGGGQDSCL